MRTATRTAVAVVILSVLLAPAALAQTTQLPKPPDAFLSSASGEVKGEIQFYCWREPQPNGEFLNVCADNFNPIDPPVALTVNQGELVTLRFDRPIEPNSARVSRRSSSLSEPIQSFDVPADNPTRFRADFPPGTHIVTIFTVWPQGDAYYVFELTVRPSQPQPGVLPPEFLNAIARVTEAARSLAAGDALFETRLAAVLAATAEITAGLEDLVIGILGARSLPSGGFQ